MKGAGIDYGKMSSLHNAGWAGDRIAEEMGLLSNRVNADYDPDIYGLLGRVRGWIDGLNSARPPSESPAQHH